MFDDYTHGALDYKMIKDHQDWKRIMAVALYFRTNNSIANVSGWIEAPSRTVNKWCHDYHDWVDRDETVQEQPAWVQICTNFMIYIQRNITNK